MADPLSVAGLATGVVSLGLQVCGGITSYLDALKCREQDIASARQQTDCLDKALQVVEASLPQPQQEHQAPTAAVRGCLDSCSQELEALQTLVAQLAGPDQALSGGREKIQALSKKLCYPFNRPKIEQLEMRLRNTNATLQLALQALGMYAGSSLSGQPHSN
jgi:chromosome segregation ATPase